MTEVRELVGELQLVSVECMPPLTIINKSFAAARLGIFVGGYDLGDARERFRDHGNFLSQVDQQITVP